ncbi:YbaB/EbfC family nucleoid-associated protein [Rhodococcus kronopolitis]|uniref:YbaB/EbfC family nucleoid-associated protein n=1 Tax=Rhodococcus kronopolitis TaxID=1460226 RepID=A0ABV9FT39_9NOCA
MRNSVEQGELRARNEALRVQVDGMLEELHRRSDRLTRVQAEVTALRIEESTPDGLARVTVDAGGAVVGIDLAPESFATSTPRRLGAALAAAAQAAAATARARARELAVPSGDAGLPDLPDLIPGAPSLRDLMPTVNASAPPVDPAPEAADWTPGGSVLRGAER